MKDFKPKQKLQHMFVHFSFMEYQLIILTMLKLYLICRIAKNSIHNTLLHGVMVWTVATECLELLK